MSNPYKMTISRLTVDKLGVKLYDRVSAVIAELIANSYDADASSVTVTAPMGEFLATKEGGQVVDKGFTIKVEDNGHGMTPDEVNRFYLVVGAERRNDPARGEVSKKYKRKVMGRKGVGKLAPFGVCTELEVLTAGGTKVKGTDYDGNPAEGYMTAHLILDRKKIVKDTDQDYRPTVGKHDGKVRRRRGATIILRGFDYRRVPAIKDFERQLAQRFGIASANWKIHLRDSEKAAGDVNGSIEVGAFSVPKMPYTTIKLQATEKSDGKTIYEAIGPNQEKLDDVTSGFNHEEHFYPITGWVAYSKAPYQDDLMAGVRIYCRNKIASQTALFNLHSGFTGEYDVRSYLIGELQADWLDDDEDLIQTHRQDILWSHELGQSFQAWGQSLVKKVGALTREPKREKAWELFQEASQVLEKVNKAFPGEEQEAIRDNAIDFAKIITRSGREDELLQKDYMDSVVNLSLLFGPNLTLDRKLREAAEDSDDPLSAVLDILRTARVAELAGYGKIAEDKIKVIERIRELKNTVGTAEGPFQKLIAEAPWLINPEWSPLTSNQTFSTLKREFEAYYEEKTGQKLKLDDFRDPAKRADFVLLSQQGIIQIVEIKRPKHALEDEEMVRINNYVEIMTNFLEEKGNEEFAKDFRGFHITLVCDKNKLTGVHKTAYEGLQEKGQLTCISWSAFLLRTEKMHKEFVQEAKRQKRDRPRT